MEVEAREAGEVGAILVAQLSNALLTSGPKNLPKNNQLWPKANICRRNEISAAISF